MRKCIFMILALSAQIGLAQNLDSLATREDIFVLAKSNGKAITLRWAPSNFATWLDGNNNGYSIERHTLVRNDSLITPESRTMTRVPLRPDPIEAWSDLVPENKYAAIAAQALYGDEFSVGMVNAGPVSIFNKAEENEQRFSIALLSADLDPIVAQKSGLWLRDTTVRINEKYLYRIHINTADKIYKGSVFVTTSDSIVAQPPRKLEANVKGRNVELKWMAEARMKFIGFVIERSSDSLYFSRVGEILSVTLSPTSLSEVNYNYATDSIPHGVEKVFYRVRGVTSFGDVSEPSAIASAETISMVSNLPEIIQALSDDNQTIKINWSYPEHLNKNITGFIIERGINDRQFKMLNEFPTTPNSRLYKDKNPLEVNYYRVISVTKSGERYSSFPFLVTLVDSIPPAVPKGLKAQVDESGRLDLIWEKNTEQDIYGYRVFKSNHKKEEAFQLTASPLLTNAISDQINLNTLSKYVYYSVAALDKDQNQSKPSSPLKVNLPDKVRPATPVILPCLPDSGGVMIRWIRSSSVDVRNYEVYRSERGDGHRIRLKNIPASADTIFLFYDPFMKPDKAYIYNVLAIDSSENQSAFSASIIGKRLVSTFAPPVTWGNAVVSAGQKTVLLVWQYRDENVESFKIYKSQNGTEEFILYKTVRNTITSLSDSLNPEFVSRYKIMAVLKNGKKSKLSEQLIIQF